MLALLALGPALAAGSLKDLDKHNGFRDLALTQKCSEIEGLKANAGALKAQAAHTDPESPWLGLVHHTRPTDELRVGKAHLIDIGYTCYADQLHSVRLLAVGKENGDLLLATLEEAFGRAPVADDEARRYRWAGKKVVLTFDHDAATDFVAVTFLSVPMRSAKDQNDETLRKSAVQDL
jgi:hypothetical protein